MKIKMKIFSSRETLFQAKFL